MILVDTDVLIWYMRGNRKAYNTIEKIESFCISVVNYMELVQGLRDKTEFKILRDFLKNWNVKIIYINEEISIKAMFLVEQHYLSNSLVLADALIAATSIINDLKLLTANTKHYKNIKNLEIIPFNP